MDTFSRQLLWSDEDEGYIALCAEFPGLSAFGDTPENALAELQVALDAALETYASEGWSLPAPQQPATYSGKFVLRVSKTLHGRLAQQAEKEGVSLNALAATLLAEGLAIRTTMGRVEHAISAALRPVLTNVNHMMTFVWGQQTQGTRRVEKHFGAERRAYPVETSAANTQMVKLSKPSPVPVPISARNERPA